MGLALRVERCNEVSRWLVGCERFECVTEAMVRFVVFGIGEDLRC